ncbi:shikimate kinase [Microvirga sp. STS02]|uniref:shikimate kinase n=1 Tax=Hymenobacter negativus TaxID=2795026 RepID=UPI0018DCB548|nr:MULTISPECIES: shikimate kinase [Bacteria]MBH8570621.1 shikimate kinase [Hymenobacter negativus]MBR7210359.1 shikimate kinase [Microvirga sp. STS02]
MTDNKKLPLLSDTIISRGGSGHLSLVGLPGAGKTTLGRQLAAHFNRPFLDLDVAIEARTGRSVRAIFAEDGEASFRAVEAAVLRDALAHAGPPLVLATGGGTPCFHDNMALLNQAGPTLWLDVPIEALAARLPPEEVAKRPLLAAAGGAEAWLRETLAARSKFYAQARLRCGAACTLPAVVAQLAGAGFALPATLPPAS